MRLSTLLCATAFILGPLAASAAEARLPFVGTWARTERACAAPANTLRAYTETVVTTIRSKCPIASVDKSGDVFDVVKDCPRNGRTDRVFETIRMIGPNALSLATRLNRLKMSASRRYVRCS